MSTRFSELTLEKVRIQAAHENRTVCNMVAVMVERYLECVQYPMVKVKIDPVPWEKDATT